MVSHSFFHFFFIVYVNLCLFFFLYNSSFCCISHLSASKTVSPSLLSLFISLIIYMPLFLSNFPFSQFLSNSVSLTLTLYLTASSPISLSVSLSQCISYLSASFPFGACPALRAEQWRSVSVRRIRLLLAIEPRKRERGIWNEQDALLG